MKRETLKLKKPQNTLHTSSGTQQQLFFDTPESRESMPSRVTTSIGRKRTSAKSYVPSSLFMDTLSNALDRCSHVFIQLRSGTGYSGLPVQIQGGWVMLSEATVHGTKRRAQVNDLLIQLGDCSQVAHIHYFNKRHHDINNSFESGVTHG